MSKNKRIPPFIINPPSEITYNKIFQFNNDSYLLRYQIGEFENKLKNNDKELTNILLKENLNRIIVIRQSNIQVMTAANNVSYRYYRAGMYSTDNETMLIASFSFTG
jgi:hypothetical protein